MKNGNGDEKKRVDSLKGRASKGELTNGRSRAWNWPMADRDARKRAGFPAQFLEMERSFGYVGREEVKKREGFSGERLGEEELGLEEELLLMEVRADAGT